MISKSLRMTLRSPLQSQQMVQVRGLKRPPLNTSQLPEGRRTGALVMKVGMLAVWDKWGVRYPVTVLHVDNCRVVQTKTFENDGYCALQLGVGEAKLKRVNKPLLGHFKAAAKLAGTENNEVSVNRKLREFHVSPDCTLAPGTQIFATHFVPGQLVDVCGVSKGKGFQGAMKRHNFAGGRASHGNSLNHRTLGSTGCRQDPGKVFKGKKMAGRMGGDRKTIQNMKVLKIDVTRNLLYVQGSVPGQKGAFLRVTDAVKGPFYPPAAVTHPASPLRPAPFELSANAYNPYPLPIPTMTAMQRDELISHLVKRGDARDLKEAVVSLWASTAGVSRAAGQLLNVDVSALAGTDGDAPEIDPGKGVEVSDPYVL